MDSRSEVLVDPPIGVGDGSLTKYLVCNERGVSIAKAFKRKRDMVAWLDEHDSLESRLQATLPSLNWRHAFSRRLMERRFALTCRKLEFAHRNNGWDSDIKEIADMLHTLPRGYLYHSAKIVFEHRRISSAIIKYKIQQKDVEWLSYIAELEMIPKVVELTVESGDDDLIVEVITRIENIPYYVKSSIFYYLLNRADDMVKVCIEKDIRIGILDGLKNHRSREAKRMNEPSVPPLPNSFYKMLLDFKELDKGYNHHSVVMSMLNSAIEFHENKRISKKELDEFRDKLFSMASQDGAHKCYAYLHDLSNEVLTNRLRAAVCETASIVLGNV